jgi:FkbM family methyltransferase
LAFNSLLPYLPQALRRLLSPRRSGLDQAKPFMRALVGDQRLVAVDVGAAKGILPHWFTLDGIALIYQVEPRNDACEELVRINKAGKHPDLYRVLCAAVAGSNGPRTLYVSQVETGTSLFYPNVASAADGGAYVSMEYFFPINEETVQTQTLDTLLTNSGENQVDLIKLDIQGTELEALQGMGRSRLDNLLAIELEIGLLNIYREAPDFGRIQEFMNERGFDLFDVRVARSHLSAGGSDSYYQTKIFSVYPNSPTISARACEFDAVYFRRRSSVLNMKVANQIRRMVACYLTYNFFSEAFSLVEEGERLGIVSAEVAEELKDLIVKIHYEREFLPWLADTRFWNFVRRFGARIAPRSAPRWCQYMYQNYPSG